jgi:hypothetical protein
VAPSRSGKFWGIIAGEDKKNYFAYGKNFLNCFELPRVGRQCEFTRLPPSATGPLPRATEIHVLAPQRREDKISVFLNQLVTKMQAEALQMFKVKE